MTTTMTTTAQTLADLALAARNRLDASAAYLDRPAHVSERHAHAACSTAASDLAAARDGLLSADIDPDAALMGR